MKFLFEDNLPHQTGAIKSTVALFDELPKKLHGLYAGKSSLAGVEGRNPHITMGTRMLDNLRNIQLENRRFSDDAREGWDNPKIFTLCTLKVSASEIAKKQEIDLENRKEKHGNQRIEYRTP